MSRLFEKQEKFRDFDVGFQRNPLTNDLITKDTFNSIRQSVKLLVLTRFYERPYRPHIGTKIANALFEMYSYDMIVTIEQELREYLGTYEPRIQIKSIDVSGPEELDSNGLSVQINYFVIGALQEIKQNIILKRVR